MIGLGTYAFFWQHSDRAAAPLTIEQMLRATRELRVDLFQICDYPAIFDYSIARLRDIAALAAELGITLELGTRGVAPDHLARTLEVAQLLGARLVRSMIFDGDDRPTLGRAEVRLRDALPGWEDADVTLALETYEQIATADLVGLIETIGSTSLGICLDPANTVARLENPNEVIDLCAPYVANIHVKDFAFTRRGGWVGFTLEGAPLGTGLLDYDHLVRAVAPDERGINQVIEHWLPLLDSFTETVHRENEWNDHNLDFLRQHATTDLTSRSN